LHQIDPIYVYFNVSDLDLARLVQVVQGIPGQGADKKWPVSMGLPLEEGYPHQGQLDFPQAVSRPDRHLLMRSLSQSGGKCRAFTPGYACPLRPGPLSLCLKQRSPPTSRARMC
jgi:hypothetical protein